MINQIIRFFLLTIGALIIFTACRKVEKLDNLIDYDVAYVVNGESNSITMYNTATLELVEEVAIQKGSWAHHINTNMNKDKLLISITGTDMSSGHAGHDNETKSYILELSAKELKVLNFKKLDHVAHNAIYAMNDQEIWVPQLTTDGYVIRLSADNMKELGQISVGSEPLEITMSANAAYYFVCNGYDNTVSVISATDATVVKTIQVGDEPVGAWPAANNKMYADCEVSKEIYEIDVTTLNVTDTITLTFTPAYVAYNDFMNQLWVTDAEHGGVRYFEQIAGEWIEMGFLATGNNAHAIAFSEDEKTAFITNQNDNTLSVVNVLSLTVTNTLFTASKPNGILITP
ncbi:MAG: YncE family protein [Crocinitomicaceae bacterium]|nr:YncE family protein [Crocinitomicaceae bacterium]MBK8926772.1 YncE family protein [Crocinitomicaceae bacterium]